jgi:hypothetical protein
MNWRLIGVICVVGVALGVVMLYVEFAFWTQLGIGLALAAVFALILARFQPERHFLHGFVAGLIYGTVSSFLTGLMWETYLEYHPMVAEEMEEAAATAGDWVIGFGRYMTMLGAPLNGAITGLILGVLAWLASKVIRPPHPSEPETVEPELPPPDAPPPPVP